MIILKDDRTHWITDYSVSDLDFAMYLQEIT